MSETIAMTECELTGYNGNCGETCKVYQRGDCEHTNNMITVVYMNIGRHKGNKVIDIVCPEDSSIDYREALIANGAREFLASSDVTAVEYKNNKFKIYAGFQIVGKAEIV